MESKQHSSGVWNPVDCLGRRWVLQKLALVHCLEVTWETLSQDRVRLRHHLHDLLLRVAVDEAEVLLELVVRRLEFKVGRNVTAQSIKHKHRHTQTRLYDQLTRNKKTATEIILFLLLELIGVMVCVKYILKPSQLPLLFLCMGLLVG